jgi:hypothetical protein
MSTGVFLFQGTSGHVLGWAWGSRDLDPIYQDACLEMNLFFFLREP